MNKRQKKKLIKKTIFDMLLEKPYSNRGFKLVLRTNIAFKCGSLTLYMDKGNVTSNEDVQVDEIDPVWMKQICFTDGETNE